MSKETSSWYRQAVGSVAFYAKSAVVNSRMRLSRRLETLYRLSLLGSFVKNSGLQEQPHFQERFHLYEHIHETLLRNEPIDYLEFGVFHGDSIRKWTSLDSNPRSRFFGFDTFEGLPESWLGLDAGHFSTGGNFPDIADHRVRFFKGLFQDTLGQFLNDFRLEGRLVIHCDADLYTSTLFVLAKLDGLMRNGAIVIFDEFGSVNDEFRAYADYTSSFRRNLIPIGWSGKFYEHMAFLVSEADAGNNVDIKPMAAASSVGPRRL